jgi:hypothetical protein
MISRRGASSSVPHSCATDDAAVEAGGAESVEHLLDLSRGVIDPPGAAGGEQQLLLLELEGEQLEQLAFTPEQRGQLVRAHGVSSIGGGLGGER